MGKDQLTTNDKLMGGSTHLKTEGAHRESCDPARGPVHHSQCNPYYVLMATCNQPAGRGSAKSMVKRPLAELYPMGMTGAGTLSDATAWANPGWVTSSATAGGALELPLASYAPDLAQSTQIIAMVIRGSPPSTPPGTTTLFGNLNGVYGFEGYAIQAVEVSGLIHGLILSSAGHIPLPASNGIFLDGTDHSLLLMIHCSGLCALYRDGELDRVWQPNAAIPLGATAPGAGFALGGSSSVAGIPPQPSLACQFKGVHILSIPREDGFPLNLGELAQRHHEQPMLPWSANDLKLSTKTVGLFWAAGQSNENGAGNTVGVSGAYGPPVLDQQDGRSVLSSVNAALAERGSAALWARTAAGGTGLADTWCGRIRAWSSAQIVVSGSYMSSAGKLYRCNNPVGFVGVSLNMPSAGTGADGVSWADLGSLTAEDTTTLAGTGVYASTSIRWDPAGLIAAARDAILPLQGVVDATVGIISIGQGDATCEVPLDAYSDAMQKLALYWLAQGISKVLLCNTVRTAIPQYELWYDTHLIPGRADALAALASNRRVFAGHDWAGAIGPVSIQTSPLNKGVKPDQVHMTDATYELYAVPETLRALTAAGI